MRPKTSPDPPKSPPELELELPKGRTPRSSAKLKSPGPTRRSSSGTLRRWNPSSDEPRRSDSSPEIPRFGTERGDDIPPVGSVERAGASDWVPPPPLHLFGNRPLSDHPLDSDRPPPHDAESDALEPTSRPRAQGAFAKTPLVHLLVYALDNKLRGTLLIDARGQRSALCFDDGHPCKALTSSLVAPLDKTLLSMGLLDADTLSQTLRAVALTPRLHGRYLVEQGLLTRAQLRSALQQRLVNEIGFLMRLPPETRYGYYDGEDMLSRYGGTDQQPLDPLPLIMMGVRKYLPWESLDTVLPRIANTAISLHTDAAPGRLGLKPHEEEVVRLVASRSMTLNEMLANEDVDEEAAQRVVYALVITRCFDLSAGARKPVGVA